MLRTRVRVPLPPLLKKDFMDRFLVSYRVSEREERYTLMASTPKEAATMTECYLRNIDLNCKPEVLSVERLIVKAPEEASNFSPKRCYNISYDGRDACQ